MTIRFKSIVLILVLLALSAPAYGIDIFPLSDLKPGMTGVGYTVINGTEIESFSVEIVGVIPQSGQTGDRIIVRAYGDVIDRAGGVAQGMSGSPIYIDNKFVGAIGYGWGYTDHRTAMLTSAADMVRLLQLIPETPSALPAADQGNDVIDDASMPLLTPISVSGFGHRSRTLLSKVFGPLNMAIVPSGTSTTSNPSLSPDPSATQEASSHLDTVSRSVVPGGAIAALLVRGDVKIGSIGTLTEVSGDRFVAFAHPWFHRGKVSYFLNGVSVLMTMPSLEFPFKVGTIQEPIGAVLQDRGAGIAGIIGQDPPSIDLDVSIKDNDQELVERFSVEVVRDDALSATLLAISALEGLDRGLDRLGPGTAKVRFTIKGDHLPRPIERENLFYSASDIAGLALSEFYDALLRLSANAYVEPEFTEVTVDAEIEEERRTAQIEHARPMRRRVTAGGEVEVTVTLVPFRSTPIEVVVPVTIPKETAPGPLTITVRGGDRGMFSPLSADFEAYLDDTLDMEWDDPGDIQSEDGLLRLIEDIESAPKSNDIVIEFYPVLNEDRESSPENRADQSGESDHSPSLFFPVRTVHPSEYVVRGLHSIEVLVTPNPEFRQSNAADTEGGSDTDVVDADEDQIKDQIGDHIGYEIGEETEEEIDDPADNQTDDQIGDPTDDQTAPSTSPQEPAPPTAMSLI